MARSTAADVIPQDEELGLREQNRLEKVERIKLAARDLFSKKGFDEATTREIAKRARIAMGTLFNYVDDKRDLIFLAMSDGMNDAIQTAKTTNDPESPLIEQLVHAFSGLYLYFSENVTLSRILLRELAFYSEGKLAGGFQETRFTLMSLIEKTLHDAKKKGRIKTGEDTKLAARAIFFIYSGAVRWWIADAKPDYQAGLNDLRRLLESYLGGISVESAKTTRKK